MSINIARTFETGASIVRVDNFNSYAPEGYKAKVLEGYKYRDNVGSLMPIIDYIWELAEDKTPTTIITDNSTVIASLNDKIAMLEQGCKSLIEDFAEARCLGEVAKIARDYGYQEQVK